MPVVPYYHGRPARLWAAVMSISVQATTATQAAGTSPAKQQPAASAARQGTPGETTTPVATASTSPWETWASNWFTPHR
jgi:hypothetical protein